MTNHVETQDRFFHVAADIEGFNAYLFDFTGWTTQQLLDAQLWTYEDVAQILYLNARDSNGDPATGESCLFMNDALGNTTPNVNKLLSRQHIQDSFDHGFELQTLAKSEQGDSTNNLSGSCTWLFGVNETDDPLALGGHAYQFPVAPDQSARANTAIMIEEGGFLEFTVHGYITGGSTVQPWLGHVGTANYIEVRPTNRIRAHLAGITYEGTNWDMPSDGLEHTVRFDRNGQNMTLYIDGTPLAIVVVTALAVWELDRINDAGGFTNNALVGYSALSYRSFVEDPTKTYTLLEADGIWEGTGTVDKSDIVENGSFDDATLDGWTVFSTDDSAYVDFVNDVSGRAPTPRLRTVNGYADCYQEITCIVGAKYEISAYYHNSGSKSKRYYVAEAITNPVVSPLADSGILSGGAAGVYTDTFVATATTLFVSFRAQSSGANNRFDDVSIRRVANNPVTFTNTLFDESRYGNFGGTSRRLRLDMGNNAGVMGWALYDDSQTIVASHTRPDDQQFHDVRVVVSPSPNGTSWGTAQLLVDGAAIGAPTNWAHDSTADSELTLTSGSSANNRFSKHILVNLFVYGDDRAYSIIKEGFDINVLGGILGSSDVAIEIAETAKDAVGCTIVELAILGNTKVTITAPVGIDLKRTFSDAGNVMVINPTNTEGVRRVYITKDAGSTASPFYITELHTGV